MQVAEDTLLPQYPWQQGTSVEHAAPSAAQDGTSQKQVALVGGLVVPHGHRFSSASSP